MKQKVMRTYKYKLYKSKKLYKIEYLLGISCFIYNHCIALQRRYYKLFGKNISKFTLINHITKLKKQKRFNFWKELNSQTIQDIAERVCRSYKCFFSNHKKNKRANPPKFCKKEKYRSITYKQSGYKLKDNVLIFQKKLQYMATKCGCTVIKVGKWFASSQICSDCGYKNEGTKDLHLRKWTCPHCGTEHDRDINAAINIRNEGIRILYEM